MRYLSILPLLLITAILWGQDPDHKRMKRDIEVAENIIDALLDEISSHGMQNYRVDGTYLDSYGMLFTIQNKWSGFGLSPRISVAGQTILRGKVKPPRTEDIQAYKVLGDSLEAAVETNQEDLKSVVKTFFADYGYLLTKLPEEEKICIKYTQGGNNFWGITSTNGFPGKLLRNDASSKPGFAAVIQQEVVQDFRRGKIDREALVKKIEFTKNEVANPETDRELILLNSIFNRLYQRDLSEGFFMRGNGRMEKIAGLGALFSYSFVNKRSGMFGLTNKPTYFLLDDTEGIALEEAKMRLHEKQVALEERRAVQEKIKEEQPDFNEFLEGFKSNIIEYGSTVRNLDVDEVLSFELEFPSCRSCDDRPEMVKIIAKQSLLEKYRKGNIELEDAAEQLQVTY